MPTAMIRPFLDKMPMFDPAWPDEQREVWLRIACNIMAEIRRQMCCDLDQIRKSP